MAYTSTNFKTKKELKLAVESGRKISVYTPGGMFPDPQPGSKCAVEGPHYPQPHKWYASVQLDNDGYIVKVS